MKRILSRDNPKVKHALKLKNRKFRHKEEMFLIEGEKMFEEALQRKDLLVRVFVEESREKDYIRMSQPELEIEEYILDSRLMRLICDTETPQGIAAVVKMPQWSLQNAVNNDGFFILLDRMSDPGNMGTIIRTAWAFEIDGILLTRGCVDPFNPKTVRASMGGVFNLPIFSSIEVEELVYLQSNGYSLLCTDLEADVSFLFQDFTGRKVLVIGNEDHGVSEEIKSICDVCFKIPINPRVDSLNAAVACAIITNEAWRQRSGYSLFLGT